MTPVEWLNEISVSKRKWEDIPIEDQNTFLPFIMNRWISMISGYIDIVDEVQTYQVPNKNLYEFYCKIFPRKKPFFAYIKPRKKKFNKYVIENLAVFYRVSTREIIDSLDLIEADDVIRILQKMGISDKEIKKEMK